MSNQQKQPPLLSYKCTLYCSDHKDKATKEQILLEDQNNFL